MNQQGQTYQLDDHNWKGIFNSSVGYYLQLIATESGCRSAKEGGDGARRPIRVKNILPKICSSEIPFTIPSHWQWYRLGELCDYGSSPKAEPHTIKDSTWTLDLEDIQKGTSVLLKRVRFDERNSLSTKSKFRKGDVLYSKLRPYLDKVIVADEDGVCTTEILPLRFPEEINSDFLLLTLRMKSFLSYVNGVTKGMKMPRLGTKEGRMALIPLPPLPEQNDILAFLRDLASNQLSSDGYFNSDVEQKVLSLHKAQLSVLEITDEVTNQLKLVSQLRQSFLSEAMQGQLVPQDVKDEPAEVLLERIKVEKESLIAAKKIKRDKPLAAIKTEEIPFEIPSTWAWCRLGEVVLFSEAGNSFKCFDRAIDSDEWGIVKTSSITSGYFSENENKYFSTSEPKDISKQVKINDFLFCRASGSKGLAGKCCIVEHITKKLLLSDKTIRFVFSEFVTPVFIRLFNNSDFGVRYYSSLSTGKSTSMNNVTRNQIYSMCLPLPPLAEQQRIVEKLETLMAFCDDLEANIKESKTQAETLLQVALKEALEPKELAASSL
jgi:type I restriction enzyme S subunit